MSGFMAAKYCMNKPLHAQNPCRASQIFCPARQLIGQVSELGVSFDVYY